MTDFFGDMDEDDDYYDDYLDYCDCCCCMNECTEDDCEEDE